MTDNSNGGRYLLGKFSMAILCLFGLGSLAASIFSVFVVGPLALLIAALGAVLIISMMYLPNYADPKWGI